MKQSLRKRLIFSTGIVLCTLLLAEVLLRLFLIDNHHYVWLPGEQYEFYPSDTIMPGVSGSKRFTINRQGMRGSVFEKGTYNVLCLGGSTTECLYLDDKECWPALVEDVMNETGRKNFAVGSVGKSGRVSLDHSREMQELVPELKNTRGVVVMCGLNDLLKFLAVERVPDPTPQIFQHRGYSKYSQSPSAIWHYAVQLKRILAVPSKEEQDRTGKIYVKWRKHRLEATTWVDTLPDLQPGLDGFQTQIERMIADARAQHLRIFFVTQAAMWCDSLNDFEQSLLWMGGIGDYQNQSGCAYYSAAALRQGLNRFNERLKQVCSRQRVLCVDLDARLPRDTSVFYDDCHFNENGARKVSSVLAQELMKAFAQ